MKLTVNGEIRMLDPAADLPSLEVVVGWLGYHPGLVVVEYNGIIITPAHWGDQVVQDGDNLEIVTIVGGGS